jgi:hypothetical protein
MGDYRELRGGHPPRDIYAELRCIEERGKRLKAGRKPWLRGLLRPEPSWGARRPAPSERRQEERVNA